MILDIEGLRKSYGDQFTLNVDRLAVGAGEAVLLQGENGSGKTTLLKLICGLVKPDACGRFAFDGRVRERWECDRNIAFLHQSPYLFDMSVRANVEYGLRRRADPDAGQKAFDALRLVGMEDFADRGIADLSGGEAQRVAIARIWALKPKLCLLDEPLSHLDMKGGSDVARLIAEFAAGGATLIVSSHEQIDCVGLKWRRISISEGSLNGQ